MKYRSFMRAAAAGLAVILAVACFGCDKKKDNAKGKFFAVIAGVSQYANPVYNLNYGDADANSLYQSLLNSTNWNPANMVLLVNSQATKAAIRNAVNQMGSRMGSNDYLVFYFSGHGAYGADVPPLDESDGKDEYLIPHDTLDTTWANDIRDDELEEWVNALPSGNVAVILDSCFSGGMYKSTMGTVKSITKPGSDLLPPGGGDDMIKDLSRSGCVVMTASDAHETSIETGALGHGLFTYYLLEGFNGPANANGNAEITAEESYNYVQPRVVAYEPTQHPQFMDKHGGEYALIIR